MGSINLPAGCRRNSGSKIKYNFKSVLWRRNGAGGWYFLSVPAEISKEIREHLGWQEKGWGRMKALASLAMVEWETAIWYDSKQQTYLLPVKASIRNQLKLMAGNLLELQILL